VAAIAECTAQLAQLERDIESRRGSLTSLTTQPTATGAFAKQHSRVRPASGPAVCRSPSQSSVASASDMRARPYALHALQGRCWPPFACSKCLGE